MTEKDLLEYCVLGERIKRLSELYNEEGRKMSSIGSPNISGLPRGGSNEDEALHAALDIRASLLEDITEANALRRVAYRKVTKVMNMLIDEAHVKVFTALYLEGKSIRDTASQLKYSLSSIYRMRTDIWNIAAPIEA